MRRIWGWLSDNKAWVFSGLGIMILSPFWNDAYHWITTLPHAPAAIEHAPPKDPIQQEPAKTPPPTVRQPAGPDASAARSPPVSRQPTAGSDADLQPAFHLGGQRWTFGVGGKSVNVDFGAALDHPVTISGGAYGTSGRWGPMGPASFQIVTATYLFEGWFQHNGNAQIVGCGGYVAPRGGGDRSDINTCERSP